jgi:hypothetical protein
MSQQERLMAQGQLAELEVKAEELKIEAQGLRDNLRVQLYEFNPVEEIDTSAVGAQAIRLSSAVICYKQVISQIKAIKKALGK